MLLTSVRPHLLAIVTRSCNMLYIIVLVSTRNSARKGSIFFYLQILSQEVVRTYMKTSCHFERWSTAVKSYTYLTQLHLHCSHILSTKHDPKNHSSSSDFKGHRHCECSVCTTCSYDPESKQRVGWWKKLTYFNIHVVAERTVCIFPAPFPWMLDTPVRCKS